MMLEANWSMIFIIIPFLLLLFRLYKQGKLKQYYKKNLPPSPNGLPIIGHLHLLGNPLHKSLQTLSSKYGPIMSLRFGMRNVVVVTSPSIVEECFTKNDTILAARPRATFNEHVMYNNTTIPAASYGEHFRVLRRVTAQEMYSSTSLDDSVTIRQDELKLLVSQLMRSCLAQNGSSTVVNLKTVFSEFTINMVSMMEVGKRLCTDYTSPVNILPDAVQFRYLLKEFLELIDLASIEDSLPLLRWFDFKGMEGRMMALRQKVDKFINDLIAQRHEDLLSIDDGCTSNLPRNSTMIDKLPTLKELEPEFYTGDILRGHVLTILILGSEALFSTMEWAMALLLNHPDTMQKVQYEIDAQVGRERLIQEDDIRNLPCLQNVIHETLRLYTPDPLLIPHRASEDCTIDGYDIPKGTTLMVNAWVIHHDPNVWDNPDKFIPERFEGRNGLGYDYIPFGAGRRSCPGAALSNRMMVLVIGGLLQSFDWKTVGDEEVDMKEWHGLLIDKLNPTQAICKPRMPMIQLSA